MAAKKKKLKKVAAKSKSARRSRPAAKRAKPAKKAKARAAASKGAGKIHPVPPGTPAIIAGFAVPQSTRAIEFLKTVFGAKVLDLMKGPGDSIAHCDLRVGDSRIMCGDHFEGMGGSSQTLRAMFYVKDCDATFAKALAAGATVKQPLQDQFYGDRTARVLDACGNEYVIATHKENVPRAEMERRLQAMMSGASAAPAAQA